MTVSDKLTYLNTTKGLIKDSINLTGANILSTDTFRSYATKLKNGLVDIINNGIDTLYDNFPKVTAEGTEIALNNTYEAPIKLNVVKGDTTQDSYTGKNQIGLQDLAETTYKGLTYSVSNGVLTVDGTATGKVDFQQMVFNLTQNTSKTLYFYLESGTFTAGAIGIHLNQDIDTQISFIQIPYSTTNLKTTKTIELSNVNQVWVYTILNSVFNNAKFRIMLSDNNNDTYEPYVGGNASPNPDYPQEVKVITGLQNVEVVGKNLLPNINKSDTTSAGITFTYNSENGTYTANGTNNGQNNSVAYLFNNSQVPSLTLPAGTYYTVPFDISTVSLTLRSTSSTYYDFDSNHTSITLTEETSFTHCYLQARKTTSPTLNNYVYYPILSTTPVTIETYQPYSKSNYEVDLGTLELCKINDYQDSIQKSSGKNQIGLQDLSSTTTNAVTYSISNGDFSINGTASAKTTIQNILFNLTTNTSKRLKIYLNSGTFTAGAIGISLRDSNNEQISFIQMAYSIQDLDTTKTISLTGVDHIELYVTSGSTFDNAKFRMILVDSGESISYEPYGKVWYKKANIGKLELNISDMNNSENYPGWKDQTQIYRDVYNGTSAGSLSSYTNYKVNINSENNGVNVNFNNANSPVVFLGRSIYGDNYTQTYWQEHYPNLVVSIHYVLRIPKYQIITDTTLINQLESIKSKEGTTNITISGNLPMIINASVLEKE